MTNYVDIVFDGPPGPESGRFVEVEDGTGKSISFGEWIERPDGYWALRLKKTNPVEIKRLAGQLREACTGHPAASIKWPHRLLHEAAAALEATL